MKVALVYDRVNKWGGAERVLLTLHEMFPDAPLYTSVYSPENAQWARVFPKVHTSFLQKIPYARTHHEHFPWLMPFVFEPLDLKEYDLIISVTSEAAKGIITHPGQKHICYCLTPTRYLWSGYKQYFDNSIKRIAVIPLVKFLRMWDKRAAQRPDVMIAISTEVRQRIKRYYNRSSPIVFPPVELPKVKSAKRQSYYLVVSRLVPYKKVDLVIQAFNQLKLPLIIVGTGSEQEKLQHMAHSNIRFMGHVSDQALYQLYREAQAVIFPQIEDFGLVAVESIAHGTPVIAYKAGGVLDIVIDHENGIFFDRQTVGSLIKAIKYFKKMKFNAKIISRSATRFSHEHFKKEFLKLL